MDTLVIKIPNSRKISVWLRFINTYREVNSLIIPEVVVVDFSGIRFIYPYHLASLSCLIEGYAIRGSKIHFKFDKENPGKTYLERIRFTEFWEPGFPRDDYNFDGRCLPLWKIDYPRISPFIEEAQRYFEHNLLSGADLSPLAIVLSEVFNNVEDHSESLVNGFTLTQYYPSEHIIMLSVCDFGVGIPRKIQEYMKMLGKLVPAPDKCIELALRQGFSTKSTPKNKGLGLDNVFSNVKIQAGQLQIISNNAYFGKKANGEETLQTIAENLSGTHIVISLDTSLLESKDENLLEEVLF